MATPTYDLLGSTTLASAAASVTFSGISGSYGDLVLVIQAGSDTGDTDWGFQFNSDTGSNYPYVSVAGQGASALTVSGTQTFIAASYYSQISTTVTDMLSIAQIMDYSATDKHKTVLLRSNRANQGVNMTAGRWANTNAITAIEVSPTANNFAAGSNFAIYGVAK